MTIPVLAAVAVLLGISAEGWFGLAIVAMCEVGGEQHAGSALGFGLTWVFAGGVITPALYQLVMERAGIPAAWHAVSIVSFLALLPAAAAIALAKRPAATSTEGLA
jgi:hypothetical protein